MSGGQNLLYPLSEFYLQDGLTLPAVTAIDGQQLPEPYKTLLVHETDMTSTLEKYHDQKLRLHFLRRRLEGEEYFRQVLLVTERDQKSVEFGAIKIYLQQFSEEARQQILEERRPLGAILYDEKIPYISRPIAFIQVTPDAIMKRVLGLGDNILLFGRRNVLMNHSQRILADILEVLPPNLSL
jgi:hypothetical protein